MTAGADARDAAVEQGLPEATPAAEAPSGTAASAPPSAASSGAADRTLIDATDGAMAAPEDARGWEREPGVEDEDVALAVPRAILFVPRIVSQVVLWPIVQAVELADDWHVLGYAERILYFDEEHVSGWHPTASYRSRLGLTLGATTFHDSLFGHDEALEASAKFLGGYAHSYEASFEGDTIAGSRLWLEVRARYETENVSLFSGIGMPDPSQSGVDLDPRAAHRRTYFGQERQLGLLRFGYTAGEPGGLVQPGMSLIANLRRFTRNASDRPQTEDVYDTSLLVGFDDRVRTLEVQAHLVADFRAGGGLDSRGTFFEAFGGRTIGFGGYRYWHYGAEAFHTIDLYKHTRLLIVRAAIEAVGGELARVPFSDLPRLGGADRLRGYMDGEFRDRLAVFAGVEYHYPIHRNILGELFIDAGRVSDAYGDLVRVRDWKLGYGGGFILGSDDSITLRFDIAYGDDLQLYLSSDLARAFEGRSERL